MYFRQKSIQEKYFDRGIFIIFFFFCRLFVREKQSVKNYTKNILKLFNKSFSLKVLEIGSNDCTLLDFLKEKVNKLYSDSARDYKDSEIIEIVSSVLETKTINIESNISNTTKWDSLNHMAIMIELVNKTNIKFTPRQIANATSITSILDILNS